MRREREARPARERAAQAALGDAAHVTGFTPVTASPLMSALGGKQTFRYPQEWVKSGAEGAETYLRSQML